MTAVSSAAKMVAGQLKRWLTGDDEATAEGHSLTENVSADRSGGTCTLQYRGRSYSDCAAASCRSRQNAATRERSCSVNSRCLTSQGSKRPGSRACPTGRHRGGGVREVLDERSELCRCWSGSEEPVCCCERCFLYTDQPPPLLLTPPSYSELMLLERYADLAKRLTSIEPSVTIVSTADVTEHVMTATATDFISSSAETGQTNVKSKVSEMPSSVSSVVPSIESLPPSVHVSLDGEEGYANSQQWLRWARRQRLLDDALTATACPPPNRTICHIVDCW